MTEPINSAPAIETGATAALAGYDYQLDVSILAIFRILFVTKSASRITLEHANAVDIEVELEEEDPGHIETQAQLCVATRLVNQVKLRSGEPWSLAAFERPLKHGKRRTPAKDHLADPDVHYLLVTNADVSGDGHGLAEVLQHRRAKEWAHAAVRLCQVDGAVFQGPDLEGRTGNGERAAARRRGRDPTRPRGAAPSSSSARQHDFQER